MNRRAPLLLCAAFVLPAAAIAADEQSGHDHHGMMMSPAGQAEPSWVDGTVKKVDKAAGKVTITHGPLENLGMPGMTMAFKVKDKAWLGQIKEGDHIRFVADYVGGAVTVVRYEPAR